MKSLLLAATLAVPLAFSGCAGSYVGYDGGYGPGYYSYGGPGYYDGVYGDVGVYGYDRGGYRAHYHHYDGSYHGAAIASRSFSHRSAERVSPASGIRAAVVAEPRTLRPAVAAVAANQG